MSKNKPTDPLGDRIKSQYEARTRYLLPRRTYTILRLDGCHFHTYTRGLHKPFDKGLMEDIDSAIIAMMPQVQGAKFAYTQSDEISILLTDFETTATSAWFDGNVQKITSVAASILTAEFNRLRARRWRTEQHFIKSQLFMDVNEMGEESADNTDFETINTVQSFKMAYFDARVFTIADRYEVMNTFIWRNQDCVRNSVSMVAQANFSHKELQGKSTPDMHDMLYKKGVNWATDYTDGEKNGRLIVRELYTTNFDLELPQGVPEENVQRSRWVSKGAWKFTEDKEKLLNLIPKMS